MKTKTLFLTIFLCFCTGLGFAQVFENKTTFSYEKNLLGIQFNPLFVNNRSYVANIYSIRYGYKLVRPLTIGAESYGYFLRPKKYLTDYLTLQNGISLGFYARYSIRTERRLQGFLEISPFYQFYYEKEVDYHGGEYGLYLAPGVSTFSKNQKFSIDLYYRLSTITAINGNNGALSFKINYHF